MNPLMTVKEVATALAVTPKAVRKYINKNKIRAFKMDREWRIARVDFDRFLKQNANMAPVN